ncbi:thioesterase II family protein [Romboutsia lituseburensis]|uniref:thioesterase II family protein n=1 Tax=Romboutsia lituseburensis TaxID=1537 RepID=UPI00215A8C1E|nr:thioesterase domain-containing protein [Romboutsia lituseburensis]MCR8746644.1 thioesterase domain-containing protein [Romboutsia lituseburensis]
MKYNDWFVSTFEKNKNFKKNRIFLFPYAGGGVSSFKNWQDKFENTELICAQYPGRESKISEEPLNNLDKLISTLYDYITPLINEDIPYYFFGHSFGTKVVYELVLKIQKNNLKMPSGIVLSAGKAPCYKEENPIYHLDNVKFLQQLKRFSSIPEELISNMDIMNLFIRMIKADFEMDEKYLKKDIIPINCPIIAFMGSDDKEIRLQELLKWKHYTSKSFNYKIIKGSHMFINTNKDKVVNNIKKFIQGVEDAK